MSTACQVWPISFLRSVVAETRIEQIDAGQMERIEEVIKNLPGYQQSQKHELRVFDMAFEILESFSR